MIEWYIIPLLTNSILRELAVGWQKTGSLVSRVSICKHFAAPCGSFRGPPFPLSGDDVYLPIDFKRTLPSLSWKIKRKKRNGLVTYKYSSLSHGFDYFASTVHYFLQSGIRSSFSTERSASINRRVLLRSTFALSSFSAKQRKMALKVLITGVTGYM